MPKQPSERRTRVDRWSSSGTTSKHTATVTLRCRSATRHPGRFYLPPRRNLPQTDRFRYIIPADLQCKSCTLQWRWWTGNNGLGKNDYGCYWNQLKEAGWNTNNFHGYFDGQPCGSTVAKNVEQFVGCSDVTVLPAAPHRRLQQDVAAEAKETAMVAEALGAKDLPQNLSPSRPLLV